MIGVFLQVRLDSKRLPNKALLPIKGRTVIEHAMTALKEVQAGVHALLTDEESAERLFPYANNCGFEVYAGSKDDVLKRYADAARHFRVERILRATGDNPLVSAEMAEWIICLQQNRNSDYAGFNGLPLGTGVEVAKTSSFFIADSLATDPYDREHVMPYLYRNPQRFNIYRPAAPANVFLPSARVTLDTMEDYKFIQSIYEDLDTPGPIPLETLVQYLRDRSRKDSIAENESSSFSFVKTG